MSDDSKGLSRTIIMVIGTIIAAIIAAIAAIIAALIGYYASSPKSSPQPQDQPPAPTSTIAPSLTTTPTPRPTDVPSPTTTPIWSTPRPTPEPHPSTPSTDLGNKSLSNNDDTPPMTTPKVVNIPAISIGRSVSGRLGDGQTKDYVFGGTANQNVIINLENKTDAFWVRTLILDANGSQLKDFQWTATYRRTLNFTPQKDGQYIIRLIGSGNVGDYIIELELQE